MDSKVKLIINKAKTNPKISSDVMDRFRYIHDQGVSLTPETVASAFISHNDESFLRSVGRDPKYNKVKHSEQDVAQNTFLLNPELQKEVFLNLGWIQGEDETGRKLVNKAATKLEEKTGTKIPIYLRFPNDVKREDLVPLGNIFISSKTGSHVLAPDISKMGDLGDYQTALYLHMPTGKIYQFASDLNDYGNNNGGLTGLVNVLGLHPGDELDKIGSPVIVTSGYREVPSDTFLWYLLDEKMSSLKNKPRDLQLLLNRDWEGHLLPEIVVTPPKKPHPRFNYESPVTTSRHITFNKGGKLIPRKF